MPLGGSTISWDAQPTGSESIGLGDDRIRSMKTSVQQAIANEHNFPSTGGANTGYHLLGSARAFWGTQSQVSSSGTDGRLMVASDKSRLFGVGSEGTMCLGGQEVIFMGIGAAGVNAIATPQRSVWVIETGTGNTGSSGSVAVVFPNNGFMGVPYVVATPTSAAYLVLGTPTASQVTVASYESTGGAAVAGGSVGFTYISIGTRTL